MSVEYKDLRFQIKAMNDAGEFEGYAAYKGNVDSYGDIIEHGAFKRTIRNKKQFPILFMHDPTKPVGLSSFMREDEKGLFTRGKLDIEGNEMARMVYSGLKNGYIDSMSIGYNVVKDDVDKRGNRLLKEVKLLEYSMITKGFAANELALVSGFKSSHDLDRRIQILEDKHKSAEEDEAQVNIQPILDRIEDLEQQNNELREEVKQLADSLESTRPFLMPSDPGESTLEQKAVTGSTDLPITSSSREWDGPAAKKRIFDWAGDDMSKAKRAFFFVDGDPEVKGSYKLPFADVIDGKLQVVPRALSAVEGALNGARGGVDGVSDADKKTIMSKIEAYRKRMGDNEKMIADISDAINQVKNYLRGE